MDVNPKPEGHQDDEDRDLEVDTPHTLHAQITERFSEQVDELLERDPTLSEIELLIDRIVVVLELQVSIFKVFLNPCLFLLQKCLFIILNHGFHS